MCDEQIMDENFGTHLQLNDLPSELYDEIFKYLQMDDLANMSLTCKMYKALTESFFSRFFRSEVIHIFSRKTVRIGQRYQIRFRQCIRSVEVDFETVDSVNATFLFIRNNCASDLRSLVLYSYENKSGVEDIHVDIILDQIKNVEILLVKDVCPGYLMKHCKKIHTLGISADDIDADRNDWFRNCNPKLETVMLSYCLRDAGSFTNFLRVNPQLSAIVLKNNDLGIDSLCSAEITLDYAAVQLTDQSSPLLDLAKLNRRSMKSLDLLLSNEHYIYPSFDLVAVQAAFDLEVADGLHFVATRENSHIFETIGIKRHIKRLCIEFDNDELTVNISERIVSAFPNLQCLWIYRGFSERNSITELILPIVSFAKNIKAIFFVSSKCDRISKRDAVKLNTARSKTTNASKVKIITDGSVSSKLSLVEINRCQRRNVFCPLCHESVIDWELLNYVSEAF
ncbi:uncharacterized protein LOC119072479 [Bradysia coprophila]|uniref:uncharacterized protein LOC119072479 n=1 Tax=Bradysia coprophila TaxID=38358 RepID=UPI00187DC8B5|nr:uncharacterized protein LOC119072479 [Bradysia coprophila]